MKNRNFFARKNIADSLFSLGIIGLFMLGGWFATAYLIGIVRQSFNYAGQPPAIVGLRDADVSLPQATLISEKDRAEMIFIPAGKFRMGTNGGYADEKPEHELFIEGFYIYKYEVTVGQYRKFLEDPAGKGHEPDPPYGQYMPSDYFTNPKYENYPVINVSFEDATAYCRWARTRLPTEAEWEKAARGIEGLTYPWGAAWDEKKANWDDESLEFQSDGFRFTAPVGSFPAGASPYGLLDMAGNVWEWVDSWYQPYPGNDTRDADYGRAYKVVRGGSWLRYPTGLTTTARDTCAPNLRYDSIGFRCVADRR